MDEARRIVLRGAGSAGALIAAAAAGLLRPERVLAATWDQDAFRAKTVADALAKIGASGASESKELTIDVPEIAENGAVVPIEITSHLPGTKSLAVVIEKNPFPLCAKFDFMEGAEPFVRLNTKIGQSSVVRVVAEAGGKHYTVAKQVKVTIGGCGG